MANLLGFAPAAQTESETIEIDIDAQANITIHVSGVKGQTCKDITAQLEKALGSVSESKKTSDFFDAPKEARHAADVRA